MLPKGAVMLKEVVTRFRAYQLGSAGSSFSYFANDHFTLIEARLTDLSVKTLTRELSMCGKETIDTLHITSWDSDHCNYDELGTLLSWLLPKHIEYPGYPPHREGAEKSLRLIHDYLAAQKAKGRSVKGIKVDPPYLASLKTGEEFGYENMFYHPRVINPDCNNDNSSVKLFRSGSFNVASLGDVESSAISSRLRRSRIFHSETDVITLAHHGADNGFTTSGFLKEVRPSVAICSSNFGNQYEHPKPEIRELLYKHEIPLFTTKTGDVVVKSIGNHTRRYQVINLIGQSSEVSSFKEFTSRKSKYLQHGIDSIRNRFNPGFKGLK